jgi:hypothetical protein
MAAALGWHRILQTQKLQAMELVVSSVRFWGGGTLDQNGG